MPKTNLFIGDPSKSPDENIKAIKSGKIKPVKFSKKNEKGISKAFSNIKPVASFAEKRRKDTLAKQWKKSKGSDRDDHADAGDVLVANANPDPWKKLKHDNKHPDADYVPLKKVLKKHKGKKGKRTNDLFFAKLKSIPPTDNVFWKKVFLGHIEYIKHVGPRFVATGIPILAPHMREISRHMRRNDA